MFELIYFFLLSLSKNQNLIQQETELGGILDEICSFLQKNNGPSTSTIRLSYKFRLPQNKLFYRGTVSITEYWLIPFVQKATFDPLAKTRTNLLYLTFIFHKLPENKHI